MFSKYILPILCLVFITTSLCFGADEENMLVGGERTWLHDEYRFGLPGLANIRVADTNGNVHYSGMMPEGNGKLVIPLKHTVSYGGKEYQHLTIASGGRIFLGDYKNYRLPEDGGSGLYPYVKAVEHKFSPVSGASGVPVIWRKFQEHGDVFTAVEFGPFNIVGYTDPLLCQVSFYTDGEIQVQYWNLNRANAYLINASAPNFVEKDYIGLPYVYTVGKKITLNKEAKTNVFTKNADNIFVSGKLREGWIAKAFMANGPTVKYGDYGTYIDIDFSSGEFPGVVIAYDYARENPIVGSFESMVFTALGTGGENTDGVSFWYFSEKSMFDKQTNSAGYPFVNDTVQNALLRHKLPEEALSKGVSQNCINGVNNTVYPCAYGVSWNAHEGVVDTVAAPALKLQVVSRSTDRKIRIQRIAFVPRQPRSIQFKPPKTYKVDYEGDGGYLDVGGARAPISMAEKANVNAVLHVLPSFRIKRIEVNGETAFDSTGSKNLPGIDINWFENQGIATIRFALIGDVKIKAYYGDCSESKFSEVVATYVKDEVFLDPEDKTKVMETYSVKDGFGQVVQTQVPLNTGLYRISAIYSDIAGNTKYAPKSYVVKKSSYSFEPMRCEQCVKNSAAYYNGDTTEFKEKVESFGYPYAQRDYHYGENRAIVGESAGMGEANFAQSDKIAKTWKLPVKTTNTSEFFNIAQIQENLASIPNGLGSQLDKEYADRLNELNEDDWALDTVVRFPFELTVNQSFDGIFTQKISDAAGNLMAEWYTHNGDILVKRYEYNARSQLKRTFIEGHRGFETRYFYDEAGRLIATEAPDRGRSETKYDSQNRIRYTRDARQIAKGGANNDYFNVVIYDERDRVVQTGVVRGECGGCSFNQPDNVPLAYIHRLSEVIYGVPSKDSLVSRSNRLDEELADYIVNNIEGVGINDVGASISYDGKGNAISMKMASFDRLGRKKKDWTTYLVETDAPAIETAYEYTSSGQVKRVVTSEWNHGQKKWDAVSKRVMEYGRFDRLEKIYEQELDNDNKSLLALYTYDSLGTLTKTTYYDKGSEVYTKEVYADIYGRTTRIGYTGSDGEELYVENLYYSSPLINKVSSIKHIWGGNLVHQDTVRENFVYDDQGSLSIFETDMADSMTNGLYEHDILGRLTRKVEGGSDVVFDYVDGSYRPVAVSVNGNEIERSLAFDPAGNLWMNGVNNVAYKLNDAGLPEKALLYGAALPADISLDGIEADAGPGADSSVIYAYDAGARVYERRDAGDDYVSGRVTVPGLGVYGRGAETAFSMERLDLVGGGYRTGADGAALFPLTDAQGSIRAYANHSGLRGAHAYYPYGTAKEVAVDAGEDSRRWQSKEYDGGIGNYYFGARYYDPFLGLWISPDPAGQYMNPYGYGGDPVNYVDPTGLWTIGAGIVVGWDSHHGWHLGLGAAFDLTDGDSNGFGANLSYTWNQDGSESFNVGANFSFLLDAGASYSYNSYTGQTLSGNVGVCLGTKSVACAGADVGGSLYWDGEGFFAGTTAYAEFQASVLGGFANVSSGYEWGFLGMEGRGLYAGGNLGGLYAEVSQHYDFGWGVSGHLDVWNYDSKKGHDYILKDFIDAMLDDGSEFGTAKKSKKGGNAWFGTNWCGTGGSGGVTGGVDSGCRLHDKRYEKEDPSGKSIAGYKGALGSFNQRIVAADLKLAINSWAHVLIFDQPLIGTGVGLAFTLISAYKLPVMLAIDTYNHFYFDRKYLGNVLWEKYLLD